MIKVSWEVLSDALSVYLTYLWEMAGMLEGKAAPEQLLILTAGRFGQIREIYEAAGGEALGISFKEFLNYVGFLAEESWMRMPSNPLLN